MVLVVVIRNSKTTIMTMMVMVVATGVLTAAMLIKRIFFSGGHGSHEDERSVIPAVMPDIVILLKAMSMDRKVPLPCRTADMMPGSPCSDVCETKLQQR